MLVVAGNTEVGMFRVRGRLHAYENHCRHQGGPVCTGGTQLLYSFDYPHQDFDLPTLVWDLPFLSEMATRNVLGGNAMRLFRLFRLPAPA